ncbi:putative hydrolase YxeP [Corynebacterium pelargi]|uniref:Putative hydrolase YxeP n=2 Tax=Corynebacterium pelargi TaxID=1471400 RepID=A0A410W823_9CORY|nr:putative hydrolase YxeP [Corynebacterium pelargi]
MSNSITRMLSGYTNQPWQFEFYTSMHRAPELSGEERLTAQKILRALEAFDCEVISPIGGYGIVAVMRNGEGPNVLMRADFDALPVSEDSGAAYASQIKGKMHACGHDMHTTALLSALSLFDEHRDLWSGTYIALFQPSEENGAGAQIMVADGLSAKIPTPTVCLGQHIVAGPAGRVFSMPGAAAAACDSIEISIKGKSAHGSMPHNSIDPTFAAAMIVVRLQGIVGREIAPSDFAVISVGTLESGHSNNTIPGTARIVVNCRTYSEEVKARLYAAIERVVRGECSASGCHPPSFRYFAHGPLTDNDPHVFARVRANFDAVFGAESRTANRWTASEDFANIPAAFGAPYLYWTLGCTPRALWQEAEQAGAIGEMVPVNHMANFLPDYEPTIEAATKAAVVAAMTYLQRKQ